MAKPARGILGSVTERLITAEDVLRRDSPWRDCELWDGVAILQEPSGGHTGCVTAGVSAMLTQHVHKHGLGWTSSSEQGFLIARNPDRLLAPDTSYVSRKRLAGIPEQGFIELAPDFLVEVRSPRDSWERTVHKCGLWIAHGVPVAWAIDPLTRTVAVLRGEEDVQVLRGEGTADAAPALPGFSLPLDEIFLD